MLNNLFLVVPLHQCVVCQHCIFSTFLSSVQNKSTGNLLRWDSNPRPLHFQTNQTTEIARQLDAMFVCVLNHPFVCLCESHSEQGGGGLSELAQSEHGLSAGKWGGLPRPQVRPMMISPLLSTQLNSTFNSNFLNENLSDETVK